MASIRDVAKLAQVAPSTVSLVLNRTGYVSEKTREKVMRAMEALNYVPNELARNLYRNRTNMIGVIVPDAAHPFFGSFVRCVEMALYARGYKTIICSTTQKQNGEEEFIDMLKRQMMDGIIMGAHTLDLGAYSHVGRPIVALDRYINESIPIVLSDHRQGGELAADRLLRAGCRDVVQVMGARTVSTPAHEHHFSFAERMRAGGARARILEMEWNRFEAEDFQTAAGKLFSLYPDADGIFGSDMTVCACLREARKRGIAVPEQLKMIAYDGTYLTRIHERRITAVVQPVDLLAEAAAEMVAALVRGDLPEKGKPIPVYLQDGDTC